MNENTELIEERIAGLEQFKTCLLNGIEENKQVKPTKCDYLMLDKKSGEVCSACAIGFALLGNGFDKKPAAAVVDDLSLSFARARFPVLGTEIREFKGYDEENDIFFSYSNNTLGMLVIGINDRVGDVDKNLTEIKKTLDMLLEAERKALEEISK